jgi:hypothetical protein
MPPRKPCFLSHSSKDRRFVARLAHVLEKHGIKYWYSATHIMAAKQWHDEIGKALRGCGWFLVVLTPESVRSAWVKRELLFALNDHRYNEKIIPLQLKPCDHRALSWTLAEFQFVNFTGDFDEACRQLLRIWGVRSKPDEKKPKSKRRKTKPHTPRR